MIGSVFRFRAGPLFAAAGIACWSAAALLLYFPRVAAVLVAVALGLAGAALIGLGLAAWRAEAAIRRMASAAARPSGPLREADAAWREAPQGEFPSPKS